MTLKMMLGFPYAVGLKGSFKCQVLLRQRGARLCEEQREEQNTNREGVAAGGATRVLKKFCSINPKRKKSCFRESSFFKTRNQFMLRCPRPRPRGLASPRSPVVATLRPARRPNSLRPEQYNFLHKKNRPQNVGGINL